MTLGGARQVGRQLELPGLADTPSWIDLADAAARVYWRRRPHFGLRCGSIGGYRDHEKRRTPTCEPCREALRMVKAIHRLRAARGLNADGTRQEAA